MTACLLVGSRGVDPVGVPVGRGRWGCSRRQRAATVSWWSRCWSCAMRTRCSRDRTARSACNHPNHPPPSSTLPSNAGYAATNPRRTHQRIRTSRLTINTLTETGQANDTEPDL